MYVRMYVLLVDSAGKASKKKGPSSILPDGCQQACVGNTHRMRRLAERAAVAAHLRGGKWSSGPGHALRREWGCAQVGAHVRIYVCACVYKTEVLNQ